MVIKNVQISVLIEDSVNPSKPNLKTKHGLSFYISASYSHDKTVNVMMDTGPSPEMLLNNVNELELDLEQVDVIVLSHSHYDHTGGLIESLRNIKKQVPIISHPTLFESKISFMPHLRTIGIPFRVAAVEDASGVPFLVKNPVKIVDGITTTGEVPRVTPFESFNDFWMIKNAGFVKDIMLDDQSLVIDVKDKGLVIVTGCAHSGLINTLRYAQKITENNNLYAVLGGFHLGNAREKQIQETFKELKNFDPMFVGPCHCTGKKAVKKIIEIFGERCSVLHTGDQIEF